MDPPRWLADEMLGRLARYLRFVGHDTVYAHGWDPETIEQRARADGRTLLTRNRSLAARSPPSIVVLAHSIPEQFREVVAATPGVSFEVRFDRCTTCNGVLSPLAVVPSDAAARGVPPAVVAGSAPLYRCGSCGHLYWEGSHTERIRRDIASWRHP